MEPLTQTATPEEKKEEAPAPEPNQKVKTKEFQYAIIDKPYHSGSSSHLIIYSTNFSFI